MNKLRYISILIAALIMLLQSASSQTPSPTAVYKLDAKTQRHTATEPSGYPSPVLYLTPDQALLVLVPQQNGKWLFKRITAWDSAAPKEETIGFAASPLLKWTDGTEQLKVDHEQHFALIVLKYQRVIKASPTIKSRLIGGGAISIRFAAEIVVIDLHSFKIVSQQNTSEPFLASSDWEFADNGTAIASAQLERVTIPVKPGIMGPYDTISEYVKAAPLALSSLKSSMGCEYVTFLDNRDAKVNPTWRVTTANAECPSLVAINDFPEGPRKLEPYAELAGPTCRTNDKSADFVYMLYDCRTAYVDELLDFTTSRKLIVLKLPGGQLSLHVRLPPTSKSYPAVLANAAGHTWLLLLRGGNELEMYRIP